MKSNFSCHKIVVIGTTCSGKSTLAKGLAERLGLDFIELDAIHWQPNWTPIEPEAFRERVGAATRSGSWVAAGNYRVVRDLVWPRAETVIWLDLPFHVVFWRLLKRTVHRGWTQEELWNGNREKFWWHLKLWSEESLFHWLFKTYWRRKREIPDALSLPPHRHLQLIHLKSAREAGVWLESVGT